MVTSDAGPFTIRVATEDDGDAVAALFEESPDEGAISFTPRFTADAYAFYAGLRPETTGFLAEAPDGRLAGVGFVSLTDARVGGRLRPTGLLNALAVHPDYRGRGLGKRLARRRIAFVRERLGEDAVAFANIQNGNDPSRAVAASWADGFAGSFRMQPLAPASAAGSDYDVHDVRDGELAAAVDGSNAFYADAELYRPYDADGLGTRLATSPLSEPVHRYLVATADGEVHAGASLTEAHRGMALRVESLPPELEAADELPAAIPESRELRMRMIADLWHAPGRADAAEAIVAAARAEPGGANRVVVNYDPDAPIADAVPGPVEGAMELSVPVVDAEVDPEAPLAPVF